MFEGRSFRVRHLSKNRFEFRSQYSLKQGTANEIMALLADEQNAAQRSAIELTLAKKKLREAAEKDGAELLSPPTRAPSPITPPPKPAPPAEPDASPEDDPEPVATAPATKARRIVEPHVTMVSLSAEGRQRRRPNGLSYLSALRQAEAAEKSG